MKLSMEGGAMEFVLSFLLQCKENLEVEIGTLLNLAEGQNR